MVTKALATLLVMLAISMNVFLLSQDPPSQDPPYVEPPYQEEPPHVMPTEFCTPMNRPDGKKPCECLHNSPNGCKEGQMDVEMRNCNSWCWKQFCKCCSS